MSSVTALDTQMSMLQGVNNNTTSNSLGKTDFLEILVAQMSNQDPMDPTSDTEFIAQLAQFSLLEQMQAMNAGFATTQAYSLIGKMVYIENDGDSQEVYGRVDGVIKKNGIDYLVIGDDAYEVSRVAGVINEDSSGLAEEEKILQSAALIGKTVSADFVNEAGEELSVNGQVEKIRIEDGHIYAVVDGVNVPVSELEEIEA